MYGSFRVVEQQEAPSERERLTWLALAFPRASKPTEQERTEAKRAWDRAYWLQKQVGAPPIRQSDHCRDFL